MLRNKFSLKSFFSNRLAIDNSQLIAEPIQLPIGSCYYYAAQRYPKTASPLSNYYRHQALAAVMELHLEWSQAVRDNREKNAVLAKLYWWKKEVEHLVKNQASHPITQALLYFYPPIATQTAILQKGLDAQIASLQRDRYFSVADLISMADAIGKPFMQMLSIVSADSYVPSISASKPLSSIPATNHSDKLHDRNTLYTNDLLYLGRGLILAEWIIEMVYAIKRRRLYIAIDDMQTYQVMPETLFKQEYDQHVEQLLAQQVARAQAYIAQGQKICLQHPKVVRQSRLVLMALTHLASKTLTEIQRNKYQILHQSIELTPIRKAWIAWRSSL